MIQPYFQDQWTTLYNCDCRELLRELPKVELLLTDPPWGIKRDGMRPTTGRHGGRKPYPFTGWDNARPEKEVFDLMRARSKNQIIWGGNFFADYLPPTQKWLVWDKGQRIAQSDGEIAWTSFEGALRIFSLNRMALQKDGAYHPTQKPLDLLRWCISQADNPQSILDCFAGSGSSLVAAKQRRVKAIGVEISQAYCDVIVERLRQNVFDFTEPEQLPQSVRLFD